MVKLKDFDFLRVRPGKKINLGKIAPEMTRGVPEKSDVVTEKYTRKLGELQEALYAEGRQSLLVVLQGMDAAGKDGAVRHVFDDVNPTGIQVTSFKVPSAEELRHDFLWRCHAKAPPRGYIGLFNRSYYEEVLVVRVHADKLLPPELRGDKKEWDRRYKLIRQFEAVLGDGGTRVVKFFCHISKEEQRDRFMARQKDATKHWKLAAGDFLERGFWDEYQEAYEKMLPATSTEEAPWYIIPADHKWARNYYIAAILVGLLQDMDPRTPKLADPSLVTRRFK